MEELKVGDTVCLNANPECRFDINVMEGNEATCVGFDGKKPYTMKLNVAVLNKCDRPLLPQQTVIILPAKETEEAIMG